MPGNLITWCRSDAGGSWTILRLWRKSHANGLNCWGPVSFHNIPTRACSNRSSTSGATRAAPWPPFLRMPTSWFTTMAEESAGDTFSETWTAFSAQISRIGRACARGRLADLYHTSTTLVPDKGSPEKAGDWFRQLARTIRASHGERQTSR